MKFTKALENYENIFTQLGKNKWVTNEEIIWYIDYENKNEYRVIPQGFVFNGGNSPCFTHCIVDDDDYPFAFAGHDFDYSKDCKYIINDLYKLSKTFQRYKKYGKTCMEGKTIYFVPDRKFCDLVLKDTVRVEGLGRIKSFFVYLGIRLGGRRNFEK